MTSNAISCSRWRLYVIVDRQAAAGRDLAELTAAAIRGGADVVQLRDKLADDEALAREVGRCLPIARRAGIPFIVNDRVEVARDTGADGVHLGQEDAPIAAARAQLGPDRLIGKSTHDLRQALEAAEEGPDYLACGPIFSTPTKPAYGSVGCALIGQVAAQVRVPIVCIGGIDAANLEQVLRAGARCMAVVRAVCAAPDPEAATRALKQAIAQFNLIARRRHSTYN